MLGITFLGIRGRIAQKSPIRVGTAFFSNYPFANQLGLNPMFVFMRSCLDYSDNKAQIIRLMDDKKAVENAVRYLKTGKDTTNFDSPIARLISPVQEPAKLNIIIVLMEGLSANYLKCTGNPQGLTPFLDTLCRQSYFFDHLFSAGNHTMNGIYGTYYSFPALLRQHPMNWVVMPEFTGIPKVLQDNGYTNVFFTTHDEQFDNMAGFLTANSFHRIVSQKDYPSSQVRSTLGVPDHYMFEFAMPIINQLHQSQKPFFVTMLTGSNHMPIIIPDDIPFKPKSSSPEKQVIEYSDWSLRHFIELASKELWFDNTIFVFTSDHGAPIVNGDYDMPLAYHHDPLLIYSPKHLKPALSSCIGGQIDIFPTIMGLLNIKYVNNTMGIDLINESRPYIYFSADDRIGCVDKEFFYIYHVEDGSEGIYRYHTLDKNNYISQYRANADSMKNYAFSMMQASQWMISNKKTGHQVN
jgi:phosphoglycerol transferase MdoB-like AlkP superfamily enzyme